MARSYFKHPPTPALRATIYDTEKDRIQEIAERYHLDASQALRLIIHQHAEWEKLIRIDTSEAAAKPAA